MKIFWLILALVVILAGGALAFPLLRGSASQPTPAPARDDGPIAADTGPATGTPSTPANAQPSQAGATPDASAPHAGAAPGATGATPAAPDATPPPSGAASNADSSIETAAPRDEKAPGGSIADAQERALRERLPGVSVTVTPAPDADARSDELPQGAPATLPALPEKIGAFNVSPDVIEARGDTLVVDGKYVVKGSGTQADPYVVTWEMLTSVATAFDPRAGKRSIPGRVAMLHEKHVRITGYVAFPMMVKQPRELLVMLNQWDGCCIGVPPTPYDAIEVELTRAVEGNTLFATAGSVHGVFGVKPYVVGDWLVGLYVLAGGELNATDYGGAGF
ncbi:MAG: DUF3299 domain-containing protein [Planctomycetota bacterium]|nr:DUF3299 domain-containing protein [Planctomycetota bacterium]